jgi:hypothetical protein
MALSDQSNTALVLAQGMPFYSEPEEGLTLLDRALHYARQHREIHIAWIDYWAKNPPDLPETIAEMEAVGGVEHQRSCIAHYDVIIEALEATK